MRSLGLFALIRLFSIVFLVRLGVDAVHQPRSKRLPKPRNRSPCNHGHCARNLVNLVVASEGLARISRIPVVYDGEQLSTDELVTGVLVGINGAVLLAWFLNIWFESENAMSWMMSNFVRSHDKKRQRARPYTIITAAFSHYNLSHFLSNMGILLHFVPGVVHELGCRRFAYFYISSAYASKFSKEVAFSQGATSRPDPRIAECSLGASGVLSAVVTFHCLSFPRDMFRVGWIAVEAPLAAIAWAAQDFLKLNDDDGVGHAGHLGGALFGALVYAVWKILKTETRATIRELFRSCEKRILFWNMMKKFALGVIDRVTDLF